MMKVALVSKASLLQRLMAESLLERGVVRRIVIAGTEPGDNSNYEYVSLSMCQQRHKFNNYMRDHLRGRVGKG